MITAIEIGVLAYLVVVLAGLVMSFSTRKGPRRNGIRIATAVLSLPIWLLVVCIFFLWLLFGKEPPTLADLKRDFPSKHADLELILHMSDEDADFLRIAPDFLDRKTNDAFGSGRFMANDPKAGLPKDRWDAYRKIYSRSGIKLGIQRDKSRDAFIMLDSIGLLNRGHTSGYVKCAPANPGETGRFYPCTLHRDVGKQEYDPITRKEGYAFQKLSEGWYAYDDGPS